MMHREVHQIKLGVRGVTKEETKQWLYEARGCAEIVRQCLYELERIESECDIIRTATPQHRGGPRGSNISNPTENKAVKIVDKYNREQEYNINQIAEAKEKIESIKWDLRIMADRQIITQNQYWVIYYYFIEGMGDKEISELMKYCERQILRFKSEGIENVSLNVIHGSTYNVV
jgi:hypothetical protein